MKTKKVNVHEIHVRYGKGFWDLVSMDLEKARVTIARSGVRKTVSLSEVEFHMEETV